MRIIMGMCDTQGPIFFGVCQLSLVTTDLNFLEDQLLTPGVTGNL